MTVHCSIPTRPPVPPIGPGPHIVPDHIGGSGSLGPGASGIGGGFHLMFRDRSLHVHMQVAAKL